LSRLSQKTAEDTEVLRKDGSNRHGRSLSGISRGTCARFVTFDGEKLAECGENLGLRATPVFNPPANALTVRNQPART